MNRRSFIKKLPVALGAPMVINGMPVTALANHSYLANLAATSTNDRVLVIIQLHGGNDGLNTIIPLDQYSRYYQLRPNIAIPDRGKRRLVPLDSTLPVSDQVGLHPDMIAIKEMYDRGQAAIVQGVGYENINGSHFRSRDIWFMGGDYGDQFDSGWVGRYLDHLYPGYPQSYPSQAMPDPLGIEVGNSVSLAFHRANGIPAAISIRSPDQFYDLVTSVGVDPPEHIANTHYGKELRWILDIEEKSNQYAGRLKELYERGNNTREVIYPEKYPFNAPLERSKNPLSGQLRMIARLLSGGSQTKVFVARIGGFDTHASQVERYDPTMGSHAALLYHLSESVKAFQDDLTGLGLDHRVLTVTMSEFGRRAASNGSYGTDHGTTAPMFIFGSGVNPGIVGTNPDLSNLRRNNLPQQHDYRQVYGSILEDWLEASDEALAVTRFTDYVQPGKKLPLVGGAVTSIENDAFKEEPISLDPCYPNPAQGLVNFTYRIAIASPVRLTIMDLRGRVMRLLVDERQYPGDYQYQADVSYINAGTYLYRLQAGSYKDTKKLVVY